MPEELGALREEMDAVTEEMVRMLKRRQGIAVRIGRAKRDQGRQVEDGQREDQLYERIAGLCRKEGIDGAAAGRLLNFLVGEAISVQALGEEKKTHLSMMLKAKELERQGKEIIHMEVGEPDFGPPEPAGPALAEACSKGLARYGPAAGMMELRQAIASRSSLHGASSAENVMVAPGARFCVYLAMTSFLGPGDEVIIIEPAWPAYAECAVHAGARARIVRTSIEGRWEPSIDDIKAVAGENTKMIILNYPNNPTGKVLPPKLLESIMALAAERSWYVLSDEIYSAHDYSGKFRSAGSFGHEKCIVAQSFSKSHSMTGFRIGYAVSGPEIIRKMAALQALCMTSVAEPIQYAALSALGSDVSKNASETRERLKAMASEASKAGLEFCCPDGGMYLFARLPGGEDGAEFAERCLQEGVAIAPGSGFGRYAGYVRLSACSDQKQIIRGMGAIAGMLGGTRR